MHMRITWGRLKPDAWPSFEATYTDRLAHEDTPGLQGRALIRDHRDFDTGGTLSLWESAEAATAYEASSLRREVLDEMQEHFTGEFISHVCEVRVATGSFT